MSASYFTPAPEPLTALGHYRQLSPTAGVHVSPIQLGAMSIGDQWHQFGLGAMDREASWKLLDAYFENGGNFVDTANNYQDEASEEVIGEWAEKRGIRDQLFIATKYSANYKRADDSVKQKVLFAGNSTKSMVVSVNASLKKLRTNYIDLLYVHWWDYETSIEEVMRGLHNLVVQGKVLYLGISDTPAWVVSSANRFAKDHGLTPFVIYQGQWSILDRSFEREIIPMARYEGLALAPWGVLAGGKLRSDAEEEERLKSGEQGRVMFNPEWKRNDKERAVSAALERVAKEVGAQSLSAVAIAYVLHKVPYVFPIIGGRKVEHLLQNVEALQITLTPEQILDLESAIPFDLGFPASMIGTGVEISRMLRAAGHIDKVPVTAPLVPSFKKD